mmetsp:Transcript_63498/g.168243  ORF Transcript_63498/g.168243 Transcript_63498/m.168243 type:complete len:352 (+) Transcript_63498:1029-2084(+)
MREEGACGTVGVAQLFVLAEGALTIAESHLKLVDKNSIDHLVQDHEVFLSIQFPVLHLPDFPSVREVMCWHQHWRQQQRSTAVRRLLSQDLGVANDFVHRAEPQLRHQHAHLLRNQHEIVHDVLRQTLKLLPQHRILSGNTHGARVQMALAHHDATHSDEWRSRKAKALGAQQRSNHDVTTSAQLTVGLECNTSAQAVQHKSLVCLGQTNLPRCSRVLDSSPLRGPCATVTTADKNMVSLALSHASSNNTNTNLAHKLHTHASVGIRILAVENQLGQILDGVDVMVGWRRDQTDSLRRITAICDVAFNLVARQLTTLTRFGTLRHFDLQLLCIRKIFHGDAEAARGHLLDC